MPDHRHVLVAGGSDQSNFQKFVKRFKQMSGFRHRREEGAALWQPGYYERILRNDEATDAVVRYILENPIRASLAGALGEYPFAGSDSYDLKALLSAWERRA
jgi:REP element-mobilizing transposase RayT